MVSRQSHACRNRASMPPPARPPSRESAVIYYSTSAVEYLLDGAEGEQMSDTTLRIDIGNVGTNYGRLSFTLVVCGSCASVEIYGCDETDRRKAGVYLSLDRKLYLSLKSLLEKLDARIQQLQASGQIRSDWFSPNYDAKYFDDLSADTSDRFADTSTEIDIGDVETTSGRLSFTLEIRGSGNWTQVRIYGRDVRDRRKAGISLSLDGDSYGQFKLLLEKIDSRIEQLQASGQIGPLPLR